MKCTGTIKISLFILLSGLTQLTLAETADTSPVKSEMVSKTDEINSESEDGEGVSQNDKIFVLLDTTIKRIQSELSEMHLLNIIDSLNELNVVNKMFEESCLSPEKDSMVLDPAGARLLKESSVLLHHLRKKLLSVAIRVGNVTRFLQ